MNRLKTGALSESPAKLAEANNLKGVIDQTDFNDPAKLGSGKEMVDRLSNLIAIFDKPELNFRGNRAEGDDLLGDAYEYLMRHFATESGKSKGQFYTPAEVSLEPYPYSLPTQVTVPLSTATGQISGRYRRLYADIGSTATPLPF